MGNGEFLWFWGCNSGEAFKEFLGSTFKKTLEISRFAEKIKLPRGGIRVVSALFFVVHIVTPVAHTYYVVLGSSYGLPFSSFTGKTGS